MIEVKIEVDVSSAGRALTALQREQLPFALSVGLNDTGKDIQRALEQGTSAFDRPRPVTRRGSRMERSSKRNLTAIVRLARRADGSPPVNEYLQAEVMGGRRPMKRSEILLQRAGILPAGQQTRPGKGARLDAYGNMSRGQIVQILSYFRTFGGISTSGRRRGKKGTITASQVLNRAQGAKRRPIEFFAVPDGMPGLAAGIWERRGKRIQPVLIFIRPPSYRPIYEFERIARRTADQRFAPNFERAMDRALRTAVDRQLARESTGRYQSFSRFAP